ncbi:MATE efflux family protein [Striga asiatica]|uniref:Protein DETOXIFICATION n=1 Tax=Striga asiatica TaxID=4170 RepID=A0A5A7QAK5_STRAF|nr:MATE efflux family protein [Striga asiatica]
MIFKTLNLTHNPIPNLHAPNYKFHQISNLTKSSLRIRGCKKYRSIITNCSFSGSEIDVVTGISSDKEANEAAMASIEKGPSLAGDVSENKGEDLQGKDSMWDQIVEIVKFSGPAVGLWICGPLMSLIDTVVVGQGSSIELAALGPGTVLCDYTSAMFTFLSIATSNLVATGLARQDKNEVQHQISIMLFVGLTCGILMLLFTKLYGRWALTGKEDQFDQFILLINYFLVPFCSNECLYMMPVFTGAKNADIITAANKYVQSAKTLLEWELAFDLKDCVLIELSHYWLVNSVFLQIRGLVWPAWLVGWVAQSASLGMKDSWGPVKALAVASAINGVGDIVLCRFLGFGIAGAAWATMVSQAVAAFMMIRALNKKGYNGFAISIPSSVEFRLIFMLAAPAFVAIMSKVVFYAMLVFFATSMGTKTVAAHQVMIQLYCICAVWGEPLSQTAQSFMPELMYGANRSLVKVRELLKSLVIIGTISGLILGSIGTATPLLFPKLFSSDPEMHKVIIPFFIALCAAPPINCLEGTLMAGRDLKFLSISMSGIACLGALLLLQPTETPAMNLRAPIQYSCNPNLHTRSRKFHRKYIVPEPTVPILKLKINRGFISNCVSPSHVVTSNSDRVLSVEDGKEETIAVVEKAPLAEDISENKKEEFSEKEGLWGQMVEIAKFSGPAVGLWVCGPLMSLIDTAVIGQGSSIELAALGPGTVFCDNTSYVFMFLSIATSNLVATSLARQDKDEVQHQISVLLFIGLVSGFLMLFFTRCYGPWALTGASNVEIITAANTYVQVCHCLQDLTGLLASLGRFRVSLISNYSFFHLLGLVNDMFLQIRGLAWPAVLIGWVAQSASLGMKDSWGPLKALAVASAINGIGDIVLCRFLGYGIAGAAWATMVSQVVAAYMMVQALNSKGYNGFAISIPSPDELYQIFILAAPVFVTMMSKVAFYSLLVYFATSMGTKIGAAHQVMIQVFCMCTVWGEPLSQTAQSFMPELLYGDSRNLPKARTLLKSLVIIGGLTGLVLGCIGTSVPWLFPKIFSHDPEVTLELLSSNGYGLTGCWFTLVGFQWSRFLIALRRLTLTNGMLYSEDFMCYQLEESHYNHKS